MSTLSLNNFPKSASADLGRTISIESISKRFATTLLGVVGLCIVYPVLLIFRSVLLFKSRQLYKRIVKDSQNLYKEIQKMSAQEQMDEHLRYERYKNEVVPDLRNMEKLLSLRFKHSYIARYVINYTNASIEIILNVEKDIKSIVYPSIDQPLSDDQLQELMKAYQGISLEDWDDAEDDYQRVYLNQ